MYLLNMAVNNIIVISFGLVAVLSAISLVLPRGVTGLMLFGFFLSFVILSMLLRNIEQGVFYGSIIMSFIFLVDIFNR
jgi:predicted benzoate:H+ symporter BenE